MKYTKEELNERRIEISKIGDPMCGINGLRNYTGVGNPLGISSCENSPLSANQFYCALSMSKDPLVDALIKDKSIRNYNFDPKSLIEKKVLSGMKILDLGCGHAPTFARCSRHMGADVYTVDLFPASKFEEYDSIPTWLKELEIKNHIILDLNLEDAVEIIRKISGVDFDLVAEAHLRTDGCYRGKEIALPLLKQGGVHYDGSFSGGISIKEGDELK